MTTEGEMIHRLLAMMVNDSPLDYRTTIDGFAQWSITEFAGAQQLEGANEYVVGSLFQHLITAGIANRAWGDHVVNVNMRLAKEAYYSEKYLAELKQIQAKMSERTIESGISIGNVTNASVQIGSSNHSAVNNTAGGNDKTSLIKKIVIRVLAGVLTALVLYWIFGGQG